MNIVVDIETIPDQTEGAVERIMEDLVVKAPDVTKPVLIEALKLGDQGKYKTVPELKSLWLEEFGVSAKREQAEAKWLKTSFDGAYGQICCIAFGTHTGTQTFFNKDERELLLNFWDEIGRIGRPPYFIAHNAKFDLPFIYHRSVINDIPTDTSFKPHGRHGQNHFCTMEAWAGFGGKIGLGRLGGILGLGGKTEGMSGAEVWPEYQKGNITKIADYCKDDVDLTSKIYNRLTFSC